MIDTLPHKRESLLLLVCLLLFHACGSAVFTPRRLDTREIKVYLMATTEALVIVDSESKFKENDYYLKIECMRW